MDGETISMRFVDAIIEKRFTGIVHRKLFLSQTSHNSNLILQGRKTKLVIVLVQKDSPRQQGEDPLSAERAGNLSSVCDINQKMIFVLPYNDHLMGN